MEFTYMSFHVLQSLVSQKYQHEISLASQQCKNRLHFTIAICSIQTLTRYHVLSVLLQPGSATKYATENLGNFMLGLSNYYMHFNPNLGGVGV